MEIYGEGARQDLEAYLRENLQPSDFLKFVCDRIAVPGGDEHGAEALCKLPADRLAEREGVDRDIDTVSRETAEGASSIVSPEDPAEKL